MYFDKLCGYVEKSKGSAQTKWRQILEKTKIFQFIDDEIPPLDREKAMDDFFLPFSSVYLDEATDDGYGYGVLLYDLQNNQRGLRGDRGFICIVSADIEENLVISGIFSACKRDDLFFLGPEITGIYPFRKNGLPMDLVFLEEKEIPFRKELIEECRTMSVEMLAVAIQEFAALANTPDHFVIETSSPKSKKLRHSNVKIPRSDIRPHYTILRPDKIRKLMGVKDPSPRQDGFQGSYIGWRRRHERVLHSDRFIHKQGQKIWIPATWVGPEEAIVGNKRYKVMLNI